VAGDVRSFVLRATQEIWRGVVVVVVVALAGVALTVVAWARGPGTAC
jgi:hypothetical protein